VTGISNAAATLLRHCTCFWSPSVIAKGISYYADASIIERLSMEQAALEDARSNLIRIGLIAWQKPLYQVLGLDNEKRKKPIPRTGMDKPLSLGQILKMAGEGAS